MQNLGRLSHWQEYRKGEHFIIPNTAGKVTLHVNTADRAVLSYRLVGDDGKIDNRGDASLLAVVDGSDILNFQVNKGIAIAADRDISILSNIDAKKFIVSSGETFARIIERRQAAPEVEAVIRRMNANQRSFMRDMQSVMEEKRELQRKLERKEKRNDKRNDQSTRSAGDDQQPAKPQQDAGQVAPAQAAASGGQSNGTPASSA